MKPFLNGSKSLLGWRESEWLTSFFPEIRRILTKKKAQERNSGLLAQMFRLGYVL